MEGGSEACLIFVSCFVTSAVAVAFHYSWYAGAQEPAGVGRVVHPFQGVLGPRAIQGQRLQTGLPTRRYRDLTPDLSFSLYHSGLFSQVLYLFLEQLCRKQHNDVKDPPMVISPESYISLKALGVLELNSTTRGLKHCKVKVHLF